MSRTKNPELARALLGDGEYAVAELKKEMPHLKPRISEREFVSHYLPILTARQLKDPDGNVVPVDMRHWLQVSGNPFNAVDVFDDKGNVIFEVPPLLRSGKTTVKGKNELSLAAHGKTYAQMLDVNPNGNVDYLSNTIFNRIGHVDTSQDREAWIAILKRYNLLHTLIGVDASPEDIKTEGDDTSSDFLTDVESWDDGF